MIGDQGDDLVPLVAPGRRLAWQAGNEPGGDRQAKRKP
jgi:hypothetical protein